jgi:hypothetical protein
MSYSGRRLFLSNNQGIRFAAMFIPHAFVVDGIPHTAEKY